MAIMQYAQGMKLSIRKHFKDVDPKLAATIDASHDYSLLRTHDHFTGLCRIIIGQQVSTKAAQSIFERFTSLFPKKLPTPKGVLSRSETDLRAAGLSRAKALSICDLAQHIQDKRVVLKALDTLNDAEINEMLLPVRGIGPWSVEMFLLFYLEREDVFSPGDLGLRNAIMRIYGLEAVPTKDEMAAIAVRWQPYRSYACKILWHSLNNDPG